MQHGKNALTYADAGVDINAGNNLIERIKPLASKTKRPGVMDGLGGFGAMFDLKAAGFNDPVLVSATDGVGTKLRVAIDTGHLDTVGIDLVAMCVNDLICQGATPLFFLDYFATGKLDVASAEQVIKGIASGCSQSGCALIGGETAEMPGMYGPGDFDLAGFAVGAMERGTGLPSNVNQGDVLLGLPSSGLHSNGYSLLRKIVADARLAWDAPCPFGTGPLSEHLLEPTKLYVKPALAALATGHLKALAHITGGGLSENLPRVLPQGLEASVALDSWQLPEVFRWLIDRAGLEKAEALKTFNCGIGMVAVVAPDNLDALQAIFAGCGQPSICIGVVTTGKGVSYTGDLG